VNRFMLTMAVLCLAVRQRWYESKWNPWGMGSHGARHRSTQAVVDALEVHGKAFIRAATGTDPSPPTPPVQ
jgi:hypothetical protein